MKSQTRARITLILSGVLSCPLAASAVVDCRLQPSQDATGYLLQILTERNNGCFSVRGDNTSLGKQIQEEINIAGGQLGDERKAPLLVGLRTIREDAAGRQSRLVVPDWKPLYVTLLGHLEDAVKDVAQSAASASFWEWEGHNVFQDQNQVWLLDYEPALRHLCDSPEATACHDAATEAVALNRYVVLVHDILGYEAKPRIMKYADELARLSGQWDYYFDEARSQFWWELAINSKRYKASDGELAPPPPDQIILFHPSAALEYVGGGVENEQAYGPVALVEVIGYNRFRWKNSASGMSRVPLGASVVAKYTSDNTGDRAGIGALVHVRNEWSVGFTRRDTGAGTQTTWLVSADLFKAALRKGGKARGQVRCGSGNDCVSKPDKP